MLHMLKKKKQTLSFRIGSLALPVCSVHSLISSVLLCAESSKGAAACCSRGIPACSGRIWSLLFRFQAGGSVGSLRVSQKSVGGRTLALLFKVFIYLFILLVTLKVNI